MNRWGLMSALALAAALLLAGCGGDCGLSDDDSADEPQITLEQIRAANDPRSLLEKHGAVTVTVPNSLQVRLRLSFIVGVLEAVAGL